MSDTRQAIRYGNLDQAREALAALEESGVGDPFDDGGAEPAGLLAVVTEDLVGEERFFKLFGGDNGVLVEVERIEYSGYGPPAEEDHYIGFVEAGIAYVLAGRRLPIAISGCPLGARDIHHLEAQTLDGEHPIDRDAVAAALQLASGWDFDDLWERIRAGALTAQQVDDLLH